MKNIKIKAVIGICIACCIYMLSCKKDSNNTDNKNSIISDTPQTIASVLSNADSLQQFAKLFKLLSVSDDAFSGGVTVLALTDNALINPSDPENLKEYVIKGVVAPTDLTNGKTFTSITGKQIDITVQNGKIFANGSMISTAPVATTGNYNVYTISGFYNTGITSNYDDPHKNEYYIEYYENGTHHTLNGRSVTSWQFFNTNNFPTPATGNCSYPTYDAYSSGPAQALQAFAADNPFCLQINRHDFGAKPVVGDYRISSDTYNASQNSNTGNCNLIINGATFGCNVGDGDSYVHINISEVKVDQDLGLEKRGYYKGAFDAILYYTTHQGAVPEKRTITGGRFMVPMGNNEICALNGTAPEIDRLAILTTGKWY